MVVVRSNKEMELTPALTPIAPYKSQTGRLKRGIIPSLQDGPNRRSHGKPHRTTKVLSDARRRGSGVAARGAAQQAERIRRVGVLMHVTESDPDGQARLAVLVQGLKELHWGVGHNLRFDIRWGRDDPDRYPRQAAELVAM